ncbi:MAG: phosphotransferase enzyme family protein [Janthinobacterium lividum]
MSEAEARVLAAASRFWGRRFVRVAEARRSANVVLRLEEAGSGRAWWLRLCRHPGTDGAGLDFEMRVLGAVAGGAGFGVVRPAAGRGGRMRTRVAWEGAMRHACLFAHAPGREMAHGAEDLRRFGRALAGLHEAMRAAKGVAGRQVEAGAACAEVAAWLRRAGVGAVATEVERAGPVLRAAVALAGPEVGLCHGDARLGNALLADEGQAGERVTFLDFEDCVAGPLALDLATMAVWLRREADGAALWGALLDGYRERRGLSEGDLAAMPALAALVQVRMAGDLARFWRMTPEMWREERRRVRVRVEEVGAAGALARLP